MHDKLCFQNSIMNEIVVYGEWFLLPSFLNFFSLMSSTLAPASFSFDDLKNLDVVKSDLSSLLLTILEDSRSNFNNIQL